MSYSQFQTKCNYGLVPFFNYQYVLFIYYLLILNIIYLFKPIIIELFYNWNAIKPQDYSTLYACYVDSPSVILALPVVKHSV